jgi:hypothetical protein
MLDGWPVMGLLTYWTEVMVIVFMVIAPRRK